MNDITYNVRVYKTKIYKGARVTTYYVRWKVGPREWKEPHRTVAQADSFRSSLLAAARSGEAFSLATGRPIAWKRAQNDMTWYDFACAYADMKWKSASAKYRKDIARALTAATPAMLLQERGGPDDASIGQALLRWGFNAKQRESAPTEVAQVLAWVARSSAPVSSLAEPAPARRMLDLATTRVDGRNSAASTAHRHRIILANAMDYAAELKLIDGNPIRSLKWKLPRASGVVDRRCVVNHRQAQAFLQAVRAQLPSGPRLEAFFALLYYSGLRPEEAINLRESDVTVPPLVWNEGMQHWDEPADDDDWGELHFRGAAPDAGTEWTDDGSHRELRQLKHRADGDSRTVPTPAPLTRILRAHIRDVARHRTAACSPECAAASCRRSPTAGPGPRPARTRSPRTSKPRRWHAAHTTCAMPACPPGSTAAWLRPR